MYPSRTISWIYLSVWRSDILTLWTYCSQFWYVLFCLQLISGWSQQMFCSSIPKLMLLKFQSCSLLAKSSTLVASSVLAPVFGCVWNWVLTQMTISSCWWKNQCHKPPAWIHGLMLFIPGYLCGKSLMVGPANLEWSSGDPPLVAGRQGQGRVWLRERQVQGLRRWAMSALPWRS